MTSTQKPTLLPVWVPDETSANLAVPPQALSQSGWQPNQPIAAQHLNAVLHNLGAWVSYLDEASNSTVLATTLDHSMRLVGGGVWGYVVSTGVLTWSAPFGLAIPSTSLAQNQAAAGQVTLPSGSVAYVTANLPFSTTADITSGSAQLTNLGYEAGIAIGQTVSGPGIPANTLVTAIKGSTCTLSAAATQSSPQASVTFVASGALTVKAAPGDTFVPGPNTVIIARATDAACSVGVGSTEMWLRDQERRTLITAGYVTTVQGPAGAAIAANQLLYMSPGPSDGRTAASLYLADTSAANGAARGQPIGFAHTQTAQGVTCRAVNGGFLSGFASLTPGFVYYADPAVPGGVTSTQPSTAGQVIAPVGVAVSTTQMLVHISVARPVTSTLPALTVTGPTSLNTVTATGNATFAAVSTQSINNAAGIKAFVDMGSYWSTNSQSGPMIFQYVLFNNSQGNAGSMDREIYVPFGGSVMGVHLRSFSSVAFTPIINVLRRVDGEIPSALLNFTTNALTPQIYQNSTRSYAKGTAQFSPMDIIFVRIQNPPAGANVQLQVNLFIEFQS